MRNCGITATLALCTATLLAQAPAPATPPTTATANPASATQVVPYGTDIQVVLTKAIDVKKAKVGDVVEGRVVQDVKAGGKVVVPKNAKLNGKVTSVQTAEGGPSTVSILFTNAVLKGNKEVPVHAVILALAAPVQQMTSAEPQQPPSAMGNTPASPAGTAESTGRTSNPATALGSPSQRNPTGSASDVRRDTSNEAGTGAQNSSNQAVGLPIRIDVAASSLANGTMLASTNNKNIKLDSGTRMILRVVPER